jgi:hypothetical protein
MSDNAIQAYQGKDFTITLQSMTGSTGYGWCLTKLPAGFALVSTDVIAPTPYAVGPVNQVFNFFALEAPEEAEAFVEFTSVRYFDPSQTGEKLSIAVTVIPYNDLVGLDGFVKYSENTATYSPVVVAYGFPCNQGAMGAAGSDAAFKYGYPCAVAGVDSCGAPVKYGFPCAAVNSVNIDKYGFPFVKYGYPGCV